jgi:hypothetical protein
MLLYLQTALGWRNIPVLWGKSRGGIPTLNGFTKNKNQWKQKGRGIRLSIANMK